MFIENPLTVINGSLGKMKKKITNQIGCFIFLIGFVLVITVFIYSQ